MLKRQTIRDRIDDDSGSNSVLLKSSYMNFELNGSQSECWNSVSRSETSDIGSNLNDFTSDVRAEDEGV